MSIKNGIKAKMSTHGQKKCCLEMQENNLYTHFFGGPTGLPTYDRNTSTITRGIGYLHHHQKSAFWAMRVMGYWQAWARRVKGSRAKAKHTAAQFFYLMSQIEKWLPDRYQRP